MNRYTGDFHAFERRNLAARLELTCRDRIPPIEVDERDVGIRTGEQGAFDGIEAERLGWFGRRQTHIIGQRQPPCPNLRQHKRHLRLHSRKTAIDGPDVIAQFLSRTMWGMVGRDHIDRAVT